MASMDDQLERTTLANLGRFILATGLSGLADQAVQLTVIWRALALNYPPAVAVVTLGYFIPFVGLMAWGGSLGDRISPRRLLLWCGLCLAVVTLALGLVPNLTLTVLVGAAVIRGAFDAVRSPVSMAASALAVSRRHLREANTWRQVRFQMTRLMGPVAAGFVIAGMGVHGALWLWSGVYAVGAVAVLAVTFRPVPAVAPKPLWEEFTGGVRLVQGVPFLVTAVIYWGLSNLMIMGPLQVSLPRLAHVVFHAGPAGVGILSAATGSGVLLGTLILTRLRLPTRMGRAMFGLMALSDLLLGLSGALPGFWMAALALMAGGLLFGPAGVLYGTTLQAATPDGALSRVQAVSTMAQVSLMPLSIVLVGLVSTASPRWILVAGGLLAFLLDGLGYLRMRQLEPITVTEG